MYSPAAMPSRDVRKSPQGHRMESKAMNEVTVLLQETPNEMFPITPVINVVRTATVLLLLLLSLLQ